MLQLISALKIDTMISAPLFRPKSRSEFKNQIVTVSASSPAFQVELLEIAWLNVPSGQTWQ
jgi:hypothetical protein